MDIFLARQPILDESGKIFGYELLFRNDDKENKYNFDDGDAATIKVMQNTLINIGMGKIVGNRKAFINFTRNILKSDLYSIISHKNIVVEILEDVSPTEEIIDACKILKKSGFGIALDDFVFDDKYIELIKIADIIKVDFITTKGNDRREVINAVKNINPNLKFLAEKVETLEDFDEAVSMGYSYFQGYYFSKPQIIKGKKIPVNKVIYLNLIKELNSQEFSMENVLNLIKKDVSLSYEVLKMINSAKYFFKDRIVSLRQAIALLGEREIRKWIYFVCMKPICDERPQIVMIESLFRAEFSELLVERNKKSSPYQFNAYLTGIMSLMDVILQKPLSEILDELVIPQEIKWALLGKKESYYGRILDVVIAYQRGEWSKSISMASQLDLDKEDLAISYLKTIKWLDEAIPEL